MMENKMIMELMKVMATRMIGQVLMDTARENN